MAAEGGAIITFIFNGESSDDISRDVTHLIIHENITVIPADLFLLHPNLIEVYCHAGVVKIEARAFWHCPALRRVIIPGVIIVEEYAFYECNNLINVECEKLESIGISAFYGCISLSGINLPSAKIVEDSAFSDCHSIVEAVFGKDLEYIGGEAFVECCSLESITIPSRNGLLTHNDIFRCCDLKRVSLIEDDALRNFADTLLQEDWRSDVHEVIDSINHILPDTDSGWQYNAGGKAIAIREWIEDVLRKVTDYKAAHRELLNEAAATLQLFFPTDAVINNILPFVELPALTFGGEDEAE